MQTEIDKKAALINFKQKDKFSVEAWENRGLMAPDIGFRMELQSRFNEVADELIEIIDQEPNVKKKKNVVKNGLGLFNKNDFDTEEREFIGDLFFELSNIVNVNINNDVTKWSYGTLMNILVKLSKLKSEKIIETLSQSCINCGVQLETYVMEKEDGVPDATWNIAKCNNCKELNLLSTGPRIKWTRPGNYQWLGTISKEEYNYEQGLIRINQIKFEKHRFNY